MAVGADWVAVKVDNGVEGHRYARHIKGPFFPKLIVVSMAAGNPIIAASVNRGIAGTIAHVPYTSADQWPTYLGSPLLADRAARQHGQSELLPIFPNSINEMGNGDSKALSQAHEAVEFSQTLEGKGY